jgi:acyl-CoA reductase-like NAD-dependent aldehyde dehydrogenase
MERGLPTDLIVDLTIDGRPVPGEGEPLLVYDPAAGELLVEVPSASLDQVDQAVAAARRAFDEGPWPRMSGDERAALLHAFADEMEARGDELLRIAVSEVGTPISLARGLHVSGPISVLRHLAELGRRENTRSLGVHAGPPASASEVRYQPAGVVIGVAPYNYPVMLGLNKAAAAVAAGCTTVWIPSPRTPLTTLLIGQIAVDAGLPPGVLNVVAGGPQVGIRATDRPDIDRISFTGSVEVGSAILRQAAAHITNVTLELGGKSANILLPGLELTETAVHGMHARYARNAGQGCMSPTRILVEQHRIEEFLEVTKRVYDSLVVGDPWDPATDVGPLIRSEHRARVEGYVERALDEGAVVLAGGGRPDREKGWFLNPAILGNVAPDAEIAREELFGPIAVLLPYEGVDQAVEIANSTRFGLAAYVSGPDLDEARALADRLQAGSVFVNGGGGSRPDAPIGGFKASGMGREKGEWGLSEFLEPQHVQWSLD